MWPCRAECTLLMSFLDLQSVLQLWSAVRRARAGHDLLLNCALQATGEQRWRRIRMWKLWLSGMGDIDIATARELIHQIDDLMRPCRCISRALAQDVQLAVSRLVSARLRWVLRMLLLQNKAFDAELSMAGIFEMTSIARESILETVTLGRLLLLPALLTDEGAGPEIPNLNLWISFLRQCHGLWLDLSRCPRSSIDFFGHGDAVQLNLEVSRGELAALCDFPSRPWRDAFEAGFGSPWNAGRATISLWISAVDVSAHICLPETDGHSGHNLRLNCIVLGSDLEKMSFFSGQKGLIEINSAAASAAKVIMVKDLGTESFERLAMAACESLVRLA